MSKQELVDKLYALPVNLESDSIISGDASFYYINNFVLLSDTIDVVAFHLTGNGTSSVLTIDYAYKHKDGIQVSKAEKREYVKMVETGLVKKLQKE